MNEGPPSLHRIAVAFAVAIFIFLVGVGTRRRFDLPTFAEEAVGDSEDAYFGLRMARYLKEARWQPSLATEAPLSVVVANDRVELLSAVARRWNASFLQKQVARRFGRVACARDALQRVADDLTLGRWLLRPPMNRSMCEPREWTERVFFASAHATHAALDNVERAALLRQCLAGVHVYVVGDSWAREALRELALGLDDEPRRPKETLRDIGPREFAACLAVMQAQARALGVELDERHPLHYDSALGNDCGWWSGESGAGWPDVCGWPQNRTWLTQNDARLTYQSKCLEMTPVIDHALITAYVARFTPDFVVVDLGRWGESAPKWVALATNGSVAYMPATVQMTWFIDELRRDARTRALMFEGRPPRTRLILVDGFFRITHYANGTHRPLDDLSAYAPATRLDVRRLGQLTFTSNLNLERFTDDAVAVPAGHGKCGPIGSQRFFHQLGWLLCESRHCKR